MSRDGRAAALPTSSWDPPPTIAGLTVHFASDDNRQRKTFDFTTLLCNPDIKAELAQAFSDAVGPLGTWRREASANGLWTVARKTSSWLATSKPSMTTLAQLSTADTRLLLNSMRMPSGDIPVAYARALLTRCPAVSDEVVRELTRHRARNRQGTSEPYDDHEWQLISSALRGVIRRARARITHHHELIAAYRAGDFADSPRRDPRRCTAEVLDHYLRNNDVPRSPNGRTQGWNTRVAGAAAGRSVKSLVHLTSGESWAFAALLVGLSGLNPSTVFDLPAIAFRATSPNEPGITLINAVKHRRGPRAAMTIALTSLPTELHPPGSEKRPQRILDTSLTTAFGVYSWLIELTQSARHLADSSQAFVFYNGKTQSTCNLLIGAPSNTPSQRREWLRPVLTGDPERDELLIGVDLRRVRRTHLERHRRPVAQTPAMLNKYLRSMRTVTTEGFQVVRDALDEQVADALKRRRMTTDPAADAATDPTKKDTILGECADFDHSPHDSGGPCRQTFLTCLDCTNARAFPRHLPFQLAVHDQIEERRRATSAVQWTHEYAGRVAQLQEIASEFSSAQIRHARASITNRHRDLARRLIRGELDPT